MGRGVTGRLRYYIGQVRQSLAKHGKDATFRLAPAIDAIIASTKLPMSATILCVGARNRIEPDLWRARGYMGVDAIDLLPSPGVRLMDFHSLAYPDSSYELVFGSHCWEHALDPGKALAEAVRVLKPGGYLYAAFPVGFTVNEHDRWDFACPEGFLGWMPCRWRPLWAIQENGECRLLVRVERCD